MSSQTPHNDVQQELEGLSPLLARMRKKEAARASASVDMDTLHALGEAALQAVPPKELAAEPALPAMRVVHRKRSWLGLAAAAMALLIGALLTYSILDSSGSSAADYAVSSEALSAELIASFEEQTADPIAFLLDDEDSYTEEVLFFSPVEDVLLDWADDGEVEEALSEEVMIDALW